MSSSIKVQRICMHCGNEFTARTTVTKYCGDTCAKRAYKAKIRNVNIEASNKQTFEIINKPIIDINAKEFLTAKDISKLLGCSLRSVYYSIQQGDIKAVNLGQRLTRIKRSEFDKLFEKPLPPPPAIEEVKDYDISECYKLDEVRTKFGISDTGLRGLIKRHSIPKKQVWKDVFVPKELIDKLFEVK